MEALQSPLDAAGPARDLDLFPGGTALRPLRICLLGYRSNPYAGGQGIYLRYLSSALRDLGHRVDVVSGPPYPHVDDGVRLVRLPGMDLYANGLRSLRWHHLSSRANLLEWLSKLSGGFAEPQAFGMRALAYLRDHRSDYDLVHDNQSLCYGMLEVQRLGIPLVTTIHHPITSDLRLALAAERRWWRRLLIRRWHSFLGMQRRVARRLQHLVTVSGCSRDDIARDFGVSGERIDIVHNGVDTELFAPLPDLPRRSGQLITTASADQPLKGLRFLLEAMHQLRERAPDLQLLVVGKLNGDSSTGPLIRRLGLKERVRFVSGISTEELVRHYAQSTVAVCPSLYEGFGLPAAEAMACGVPLVATDGGALPEITGDAAVTVPAGDASALAAALADLLDDPERRAELGERGRRRMLQEFCWRRAAQDMTRYYYRILDMHADADR
jgi:glycosyltransferase involved in cell wall biosynthesis